MSNLTKDQKIALVGKKLTMHKPTGTTSKSKLYEVLSINYASSPYAEASIINDNGRKIHCLLSRFNTEGHA